MFKISISPITRISGFMDVELIIDNNKVVDAKISGTLYRGFEEMLINRFPQDSIYFTERICGICSSAHAIASAKALEDISKNIISENATIIRDIIHGFDILQNHIRQFYLFTIPDFINMPYSLYNINCLIPQFKVDEIITHYNTSLDISSMAHEGLSILGGKAPHNHGIVYGGVTCTVTPEDIGKLFNILYDITNFVNSIMLDDLYIIEKYYQDYFNIGTTQGNFMSFGLFDYFPDIAISKREYLINGIKGIPEYKDITESSEQVYSESNPKNYNFIKIPRINKEPCEVGPIARYILKGCFPYSSTLYRIKARCNECVLICLALKKLILRINTIRNNPSDISIEGSGTGFTDTIRGALLHHINVKNDRISEYNIITPSAWNLATKDNDGKRGPLEYSLIGMTIEDPSNPIEVIRVIHSFDPCVSCATHIYKINGEMIYDENNMLW